MTINHSEIPSSWHQVVQDLIVVLDQDQDLQASLIQAIETSGRFAEPLMESFYTLIHRMQTTIPNPSTWLPMNLEFYYVLGCAKNNSLINSPSFCRWLHTYTASIGQWMETPESLQNLSAFEADPLYAVSEAQRPAQGWAHYNDFFSRQLKPGRRPIHDPDDHSVIVAAADSSFCGCHRINNDSTVIAKGFCWRIAELLDSSPYANAFDDGFYGHSFLAPHNYHRFHAPVSGILKEVRTVMGKVAMDVHALEDGSLSVSRSAIGYQFSQERGIAILESPIGLVGVIPIGMGIVSSVNFTATAQTRLSKGDELGYFRFGGSDVVLLFQRDADVEWQIDTGVFRRQGEAIAIAHGAGQS